MATDDQSKPKPSKEQQRAAAKRERRAAKTVAIVCGSFVLCWLGFFACYLINAFCSDCIPELVWDVTFFLGCEFAYSYLRFPNINSDCILLTIH